MEQQEIIDKLTKAVTHAKSVIDYCNGGDAWERECNAEDMMHFYHICDELDIGKK